jgi:ubiquinone/menaquinone biosynthesis C-methylase UbiE
LPLSLQADLLSLSRSSLYYQPRPPSVEEVKHIGCGEGRFLLPMARLLKGRGEIVGGDLSEGVMAGMQAVISAEHLPVHLVVADAEALPFKPEQFDLVMANHMLYHVNIPQALSEVERVLKPAGTFLATTNSQYGMPVLGTLHMQTMNRLGIVYDAEENEPFSLENGQEQLHRVFANVDLLTYEAGFRVKEPEPVLQYYMATQLYQRPSQEPGIPQAVREAITPTFTQLTQAMIDQAGASLLVSKPVGAFLCRKGDKGRH